MFSLTTRSVHGVPTGCLQTAQGCYPIAASARALGLDTMPDALVDLFRDWAAHQSGLARIAAAEGELRALAVPADAPSWRRCNIPARSCAPAPTTTTWPR